MAKEGIGSFLLDCHTDEKMAEIEAAFGIKGFAVIVRLWQKIYSEKGYYCEWAERSPALFLDNWFGGNSGVDLNFITEVVCKALGVGIFDARLYESYSILTSEDIQRRYLEAAKRRSGLALVEEYLLVSDGNFGGDVCKKRLSACKNGENVCKNAENVPLSKAKESKAKQREENPSAPGGTRKGDAASLVEGMGFGPELEGAAREWLAYKAERRQGYKDTGLRNLLSRLAREAGAHGDAAVADAIRESMSNNWQGIAWDRIKPGPAQGPRDGGSKVESFARRARGWAEDG